MPLRPQSTPRIRSFDEVFATDIPAHWLRQSALATHLANGVNLLFPAGERFFVRSVHAFADQVRDPALRDAMKGFSGQEGRHARAHERFFETLEAQGYHIRSFLDFYEWLAFGVIERASPPALRLATTAACEHFTALLADGVLRDGVLDDAHPTLRALFCWHAAEEIEHKTVAFDVLDDVAPGYALRMAGLAMAGVTLGGFWVAATASLLWQDRRRLEARVLARDALRERRERPLLGRVFVRGMLAYARRGFHPAQHDNFALARDYFASVAGAAMAAE